MSDLSRRHFLTAATFGSAALLSANAAFAREPEVFQSSGLAIRGYDPVGYFTDQRPVRGSDAHRLSYKGATWQFANAENAAAFAADPARFAPIFGGYCAFAASRGYLAPSIPEAWTVYEDRLYLNASLRARELWLQDVPGNIAKGMENWPGILG